MQNALNCQITGAKKKILWTLDFGKLREFILNMAKINKPL